MDCWLILGLVIYMTALHVQCGIMHSHKTQNVHKEREPDGAYSPKDAHHYDEEGEHHSEFDHEAILGSHKEAEEFDHLSPEEAKRRLGILLLKMDIDNDNQITRPELKAWILRSFIMLSKEHAKERLEDADLDDDGFITWKEYISDAYGLNDDDSDESALAANHDQKNLLDEDRLLWKAADSNNDGVLDKDEWLLFSNPDEHPDMIRILVEQQLKQKDIDNDNAISFEEFVGDRAANFGQEWLTAEKSQFDNDLDHNHDGKLMGNEIVSWLAPNNDDIANEEVEHLFDASDDDNNNVLTFDEILNHHDTFVGSEATDYGDHLHNIHQFEDEL